MTIESVIVEPNEIPTPASLRRLGVNVATKGTPTACTPLTLPALDAPILATTFPTPLLLATRLSLARDARTLKPKHVKITLVEAKGAHSGKVRILATAAIELTEFLPSSPSYI